MKKEKDGPVASTLKSFNDEKMVVNRGGDAHQVSTKKACLTTNTGVPIADDHNSLKINARGPLLMEDFIFREKIFHFDHERIPERVVHARGYGAHGYFEAYDSLSALTKANPFQEKGKQTPVFVRFSTVAGNKGSMDLARDVRGFAVKFYTEEGNWDLVGNNIPVFFIQDPIKFPDIIHAAKDEPDRAFPQAQTAHTLAGRKIGILISDGVDVKLINRVLTALEQAQTSYTLISPKIGGVILSDGSKMPAQEKLGGAPSCLFDAIVLLINGSDELLAKNAKAHEFINDAYIHNKYITYIASALPLMNQCAFIKKLDEGFIELTSQKALDQFLVKSKNLRYWPRRDEWVL